MIGRLAVTWVFNTVALFVATWLLSGLSYGSDWWALLVAGLVFTLVNVFLKHALPDALDRYPVHDRQLLVGVVGGDHR
jgi:uncharacterized membrane protein YvlD (DUF360 family)